jgi:hypothetical protein
MRWSNLILVGVAACGGSIGGGESVGESAQALTDPSSDFDTCMRADCSAWNADFGGAFVSPRCRVEGLGVKRVAFCGPEGSPSDQLAGVVCQSAAAISPIDCHEAGVAYVYDPSPQ